jgi:hypothetical protein
MKVVLEVSDHGFRDLRATAVVAIIQRTTVLASAVEQTQWTVTGFHGSPASRDLDGDSVNASMASSRRRLTSHWTILHMSPYGTRKCMPRGEREREERKERERKREREKERAHNDHFTSLCPTRLLLAHPGSEPGSRAGSGILDVT